MLSTAITADIYWRCGNDKLWRLQPLHLLEGRRAAPASAVPVPVPVPSPAQMAMAVLSAESGMAPIDQLRASIEGACRLTPWAILKQHLTCTGSHPDGDNQLNSKLYGMIVKAPVGVELDTTPPYSSD